MKAVIEKWYKKLSFPKEWDADFRLLLEKKELAPCRIAEYDNSCEDKEQNLLMYLFFCEELSESVYDEFGVIVSAEDICDDMTLGELLNRIYDES